MAFALQLTAGIILSVWLAAALDALRGRRNLRKLQPEAVTGGQSAVSIIVPARNEAVALPHALPSLLAQTHPDLEVILLDDRSTDGTPAILAGCRSPRLTALRIEAVPSGWLGKNHALYSGARRARGEWLLFTDADVVFHPRGVRADRDARGATAAALILIYAVLRSAALMLRRGGVEWRGTFYQAADLAGTGPSPVPHPQEGGRPCAHMPRE